MSSTSKSSKHHSVEWPSTLPEKRWHLIVLMGDRTPSPTNLQEPPLTVIQPAMQTSDDPVYNFMIKTQSTALVASPILPVITRAVKCAWELPAGRLPCSLRKEGGGDCLSRCGALRLGVPLQAVGVDFLKTQNAVLHHTNDFNNSNLIVRRGKPFQLKLTFSREVKDNDKITLQLCIGEKPMKSNGTLLSLDARSGKVAHCWSATICQKNGKECLIAVTSPADAIIGTYLLSVKTGPNVYKPEKNVICVLFNPWCEEDTVFMPDKNERAEYVLSDTGYLYVGSAKNIRERPWNFGQFEDSVLDCCLYLLDKSQLKMKCRKDPVIISRAMSALVNANDDAGVLFGNWSGHYAAGTSPLAWTGSAPILQQYYKTKKTVNFGQCWVFSGVLTTVMRCLGIPGRSVSNFASAHDTEENLKVDIYLNENGERMDFLTSDSIWNFHVWNDVWMKRPDLPKGFDGWQAIDATPQEQSQGIFQCGPSPVNAIKKGEVYLPYDSKFVFAEVNADRVFWLVKNVDGKEKHIKLREETKVIGKSISTKAVGKDTREDITAQYKFPEESSEERKAVETACSYLNSCNLRVNDANSSHVPKAELELGMEGEKALWPGQPVDLNIVIQNKRAGAWTVKLAASCQLESYTGKVEASLATIKETVQTEGKPVIQIPLKVAADAYISTLTAVEDELLVRINVIAEVQETNEKFSEELTLNFQYPPLKVEMPETAKIHEDFSCAFIFKNTLSIPLEKCKLYVEGLGIFTMETFDQGDIAPGRIFKSKIICTPRKAGLKKIVAKLNSNQVKGITVEKVINITE
ncbi:protein-glutamine gamma-glutamyltransferase 4 [Hemicordylus capensis]|uniref:protein-glutamine gamma-glutamyltransferase 4 n=1 Tax=Hemicordylus capensis TaxID=884348 RepID=UPI0023038A46|nr:protein-glutamine gamma-glutamyltransferase 4 [Hemicordylus capensis]